MLENGILTVLIALCLALPQGCAKGRNCNDNQGNPSQVSAFGPEGYHACRRECLKLDKYYKCECSKKCPCWDSHTP